MNNDLISRSELKKAIDDYAEKRQDTLLWQADVEEIIDNAPTVSLSTPSDIDELCRLRSDLKSGLYVGSTLRTQAQMNKFVEVLDKIIDNAPTVAVNCKDCDGYEAGYSAGLKDAERPRSEWISVSERLPEQGNQSYLVTVDYGNGVVCSCQRFFFNEDIGWNDDCVIAWQPLPEPYKKGGAE